MASYAKSSAEFLTNLILNGQSGQYTWEVIFFLQHSFALSLCVFVHSVRMLSSTVLVPNPYEQL
jgi:U3 small nucleolar RNA-associated protein 22